MQGNNELQVVINQKPGTIGFNFEELRDKLQARMELYKDAVYTDEYKAQAKKEVAALRKMNAAIDDRRKEVKRQYMAPYNDFEKKTKELMLLIDQPIDLINRQIAEMEERRIAEKRESITKLYESLVGDMAEYLPLEKIWNARWANASMSIRAVEKEMAEAINSARTAIATLNAMASDAVPEAVRRYKETLDLAGAVSYINRYEAQKAEIMRRESERKKQEEERRRQQEEERIRKWERERIAEEERIRKEERESTEREAVKEAAQGFFAKEDDADDDLPFEQSHTVTAFYKVVATPEELEQVEMAFYSIGIFFERREA